MPPLSPAAEDYAGDRRSRGFVTVPDAIPLKWRGLLFYARSEAGISFIADKAELRHAGPADVGQHFIHRHVTRSRIGLALEFRRSEEHTSELQDLVRNAYAGLCSQKKDRTQSNC